MSRMQSWKMKSPWFGDFCAEAGRGSGARELGAFSAPAYSAAGAARTLRRRRVA